MSARSRRAAYIALCVGGGLLIGLSNPPGPWYASLVKPSFNPPNWLFGPVWTTLYAMLAVVGWRTWQRSRGEVGMKLWWSQLALNFAWSPVFFRAHWMATALVIILTMLIATLAFIAVTWRRDPIAAGLLVPYSVWLGFASVLNAALLSLN